MNFEMDEFSTSQIIHHDRRTICNSMDRGHLAVEFVKVLVPALTAQAMEWQADQVADLAVSLADELHKRLDRKPA